MNDERANEEKEMREREKKQMRRERRGNSIFLSLAAEPFLKYCSKQCLFLLRQIETIDLFFSLRNTDVA